ncbi:MAG: AAA family ATPase [SAR324 cluster bacterium]|nr:AAA family ATPase [SAR324 cluster bacterium]
MMPAPKAPIGISDFKTLRESGLYYVDKSLFLRDILDKPAQVILLPRPRRFGKTLNLSTLRYFLEKTPESHAPLFHGLAIERYPEFMARQGQYPVVYLTFKDVKEPTWDACLEKIADLLAVELDRHAAGIESVPLSEREAGLWRKLQCLEPETSYPLTRFQKALFALWHCESSPWPA